MFGFIQTKLKYKFVSDHFWLLQALNKLNLWTVQFLILLSIFSLFQGLSISLKLTAEGDSGESCVFIHQRQGHIPNSWDRFSYFNSSDFFFFFFFLLFRAALEAYGVSQARGQIGATSAGLHHSNTRSEQHLQPTPQLTAMPDP